MMNASEPAASLICSIWSAPVGSTLQDLECDRQAGLAFNESLSSGDANEASPSLSCSEKIAVQLPFSEQFENLPKSEIAQFENLHQDEKVADMSPSPASEVVKIDVKPSGEKYSLIPKQLSTYGTYTQSVRESTKTSSSSFRWSRLVITVVLIAVILLLVYWQFFVGTVVTIDNVRSSNTPVIGTISMGE
jgi:hypothetical protein